MEIGKFPPRLLERLLAKKGIDDPRVLVGPRVGEDAAVLDMGQRLLVAKSDPITFASDDIGWYAVQVNANDIACTGGVPRWFMATLLLPESFTEDQAEAVFDQVQAACTAMDVALNRTPPDHGDHAGGSGEKRAGDYGRSPGRRQHRNH